MTIYPSDAIEDGELTNPELRRLVHELEREWIRPAREMDVAEYWAARTKHEASAKHRGQDPTPFPEYDPSRLDKLEEVLTQKALREVLKFTSLELYPKEEFKEG